MIANLMKQKEELLQENKENFVEFEEKLKQRFLRSLEFTDEIYKWKKEVSNLIKNFRNNQDDIKVAFDLLTNERDRNLNITGKEFRAQIEKVMNQTETTMSNYIHNYKVEKRTEMEEKAISIFNPKMDLESILFNVEINSFIDNELNTKPARRFSTASNNKMKKLISEEVTIDHNSFGKIRNVDLPIPNDEMKKVDDDLLNEIHFTDHPNFDAERKNSATSGGNIYQIQQNLLGKTINQFKHTGSARDIKMPKLYSHRQLPEYIRENSPSSHNNTFASHKKLYMKQPTTLTLQNDYRRATHDVNDYKGKVVKKSRNTSNSRNKLYKNKSTNKKETKTNILNKMLKGRNADVLYDLKKNELPNLDLTFAGKINRFKRLTCYCLGGSDQRSD